MKIDFIFITLLTSSLVYDYTERLVVRRKKQKIFYSIANSIIASYSFIVFASSKIEELVFLQFEKRFAIIIVNLYKVSIMKI